jgi:predicted NUDIX family phosphoesterase
MSQFLDAAERLLGETRTPLSAEDLTTRAVEAGLLTSTGKTPAQTMKSKLSMDILADPEGSRFIRVSKGTFGLRSWLTDGTLEYRAERYRKALLEEDVVVFPLDLVRRHVQGSGLQAEIGATVFREAFRSMKRRHAEEDTSVVQLVSVFLVRFGASFLTYKRTKRLPEQRLHGAYSMFFGGHITPDDIGLMFDAFEPATSATFLERELLEELSFPKGGVPPVTYKGLLYDPSTPVSTQHLGIAFDVWMKSEQFEIGERGFLTDARFETLHEIERRLFQFENWSVRLLEFERLQAVRT